MRSELLAARLEQFKRRCADAGLALTHQRLVIYEELAGSLEHPTPELLYDRVRAKIPSISLATIYKSVRTFADLGLLREVNLLHESLRLDANLENHHHLVCVRCKAVTDIPESAIGQVEVKGALPGQFQVQRFNIEVLGLCASCAPPREQSS